MWEAFIAAAVITILFLVFTGPGLWSSGGHWLAREKKKPDASKSEE